MTIQEYIKVATSGVPVADFRYYKDYFLNMDCEHCFYHGYACHKDEVCIEYRVERRDKEFKKPNTRHGKKV